MNNQLQCRCSYNLQSTSILHDRCLRTRISAHDFKEQIESDVHFNIGVSALFETYQPVPNPPSHDTHPLACPQRSTLPTSTGLAISLLGRKTRTARHARTTGHARAIRHTRRPCPSTLHQTGKVRLQILDRYVLAIFELRGRDGGEGRALAGSAALWRALCRRGSGLVAFLQRG